MNLSYDQRAFADRVERARSRYAETYGDSEPIKGATAWLDACERIGCNCSDQHPGACSGAVNMHDGRCSCGCH